MKSFFNRIQVEIGHPIVRIRSDRGESLTMWMLTSFRSLMELNMSFQPLERFNRMEWLKEKIVLQEMARMMIHMSNTPMQF